MEYIKIPKVYEKLKKAESFYAPVLITAPLGYGKTAAVNYYYRRKHPLIIPCKEGELTEMPDISSIRANVIIIEDMQQLTEEDSIRYLKELLHTSGIQVVMVTRGSMVPRYLANEDFDLGFVRIQENDFAFEEPEVIKFFEAFDIELTPEEAADMTVCSRGYIRSLYAFARRMETGEPYGEELKKAIWYDMYNLWDNFVYSEWPKEYTDFAMAVCQYDNFTEDMAAYLTSNKQISRVLEFCRYHTSQLRYEAGGKYSLRLELKQFFLWKQSLTWSKEDIQNNFNKAAAYYELQDDVKNALKYYEKGGSVQKVKDLLIKNVTIHPGNNHYVETKDYYFNLPREEVLDSPILMAGLSMIYDLIMEPEKSEEWYAELEKYYKDKTNPRELRHEARCRLAYLDIALPHRGIKGILRIMRNAVTLIGKGDIVLPEFSATGNMPSIMNGGLDFCEWSKSDTQIARFMAKSLEIILGKQGIGMITIALAESGFEKGTMEAYEVLTRCNDGFEAAAHGGRIEVCFVAIGILVRQHLIEGQFPSAKRAFASFEEKVKINGADQLLPNLNVLKMWLSLYGGVSEETDKFIEKIPDPKVTFCIGDRYRQLTKSRCLIARNRLDEALETLNFLRGYYTSYERNFSLIECELLRSIALYRKEDKHYKECFIRAIKKAEEYHFVRVIALEGAAILPVLTELEEENALKDIDADFLKAVHDEVTKVALNFPDYMRFEKQESVTLTKREQEVLTRLCLGMSMEDICEELNITYAGLKKHNRNIYKKLGAKTRAEAERNAQRLGLSHRG